jgi:hypothetical protein
MPTKKVIPNSPAFKNIKYIPPSLKIAIEKNTVNPEFYLEQYFKGIDNIIKTFGKRASKAIIDIAPYNYGDLGNLGSPSSANGEYNPIKYSIETDYNERSFNVDVVNDNEFKLIAQEFGYTANVPFWRGPYKPNPKRKPQYSGTPAGRIKNVGFIRAGILQSANSLLSDKVDYYRGPKKAEVDDYRKATRSRIQQAIEKYTLAFSKSQKASIPAYMLNKVQLPDTAVGSKFASTYFPGVAKMGKGKFSTRRMYQTQIGPSINQISLITRKFVGGIIK